MAFKLPGHAKPYISHKRTVEQMRERGLITIADAAHELRMSYTQLIPIIRMWPRKRAWKVCEMNPTGMQPVMMVDKAKVLELKLQRAAEANAQR